MGYDLKQDMEAVARAAEERMTALLPRGDVRESRLFEAMRYACLNGGKRLRPFLLVNAARLFGVSRDSALRAATSLEMVHCYSLVHDDLPAMDDDDLRRGKPTTHKAYDEATAILVGDALLTLAFEILGAPETHADPQVRVKLVSALARASGAHGMVGGQMIDLMAETADQPLDIGEITRLQQLKTGALIAYACAAGAILGKAPEQAQHALYAYAHDLGLAFQIADDLLDCEGSVEEVGKQTQKDATAGKATFVSLLGVKQARSQARMLADQATQHLAMFKDKAEPLIAVARFVVERKS